MGPLNHEKVLMSIFWWLVKLRAEEGGSSGELKFCFLGWVALTLRPGGLSDELLQPLHLGVHLLVVGLPGVHLRRGEEGRVRAHVGAQEVAVGAQADHHSFQLPVERKEEKGKERK